MAKFNGTLQNGTATAVIPRGRFTDGNYEIITRYLENDTYKESTGVGTLTINPFSFLSLDDYSWEIWSGVSNPQPADPSITTDTVNGTSKQVVQMGRHYCVVLEQTIPVNITNFVLDVVMKATNNYDAIFFGKYRVLTSGTNAGKYSVPTDYAFIIRPHQLGVSASDYAHWYFVFRNGQCTLYIDSYNTGLTYDFRSYTDDFRLMFMSHGGNSVKVADISWQ